MSPCLRDSIAIGGHNAVEHVAAPGSETRQRVEGHKAGGERIVAVIMNCNSTADKFYYRVYYRRKNMVNQAWMTELDGF